MTSPTSIAQTLPFNLSGIPYIDALLFDPQVKWANDPAQGTTELSYSFGTTGLSVYETPYSAQNEPSAALDLNPAQKDAVRQAFELISEAVNIHFSEVTDSATVAGDLRLSIFANMYTGAYAWAYYPTSTARAGDIWFSPAMGAAATWDKGGYEFFSALHEISHTLGLKHPFETDNNNEATLDGLLDNHRYTVMSYTQRTDNIYFSQAYEYSKISPETLMLYDIAALQSIYGENTRFNATDTVYGYATDTPFFKTIWDAAGTDEIDVSNFANNCLIDLIPGSFSSIAISSKGLPGRLTLPVPPTYYGGANLSIAFKTIIENASGGAGNDRLIGNEVANLLQGNAGNDTLTGCAGADTLAGGTGNDILTGGSGPDLFLYNPGDIGTDTLTDIFNDDIIRLNGAAFSKISIGTGDQLGQNEIQAWMDNGKTTLYFGMDDIIGYDIAIIVDRLYSLENIIAAGTDIRLRSTLVTGQVGEPRALGSESDDILDAQGPNIHEMIGGAGNDTYLFDDSSDIAIEDSNGGNDTVQSSASTILSPNTETLILIDSGNIDGTGNDSANTLYGSMGNNILDGAGGIDQYFGGAGDDTYLLDNAGESIDENSDEGLDSIRLTAAAKARYSMPENVESLTLSGNHAYTIVGNDLDNELTGNDRANTLKGGDGNDSLDGGKGVDILMGGAGNDTYGVDRYTDKIRESSKGGKDTVMSEAPRYVLGNHLEKLTLTDQAKTGIGNNGKNTLTGADNANILRGRDGADEIDGGEGMDTLSGGRGHDMFIFGESPDAANADKIADFKSGADQLRLESYVFTALAAEINHPLSPEHFLSGRNIGALDSDDFILYDTANGMLYYDPDGNGIEQATEFASLVKLTGAAGFPKLTAADILVW